MSPRIRGSVVQLQITPRTASSDLQSGGGDLRQQKVTSSSNSSLPGPTLRPLQSSRTPRYVVLLLRGCELLLFLFWFQFEHHHVGIRKTVITHQSASKRHSAFVSHREHNSQNDQISRSKVSIFRFRKGDNFPLFFAGRSELDRMLMFGRVFILSSGKQEGRPVCPPMSWALQTSSRSTAIKPWNYSASLLTYDTIFSSGLTSFREQGAIDRSRQVLFLIDSCSNYMLSMRGKFE